MVKFLITFYGINYTTDLIAGQDIEANSIFVTLFKIILVIFAIYILKCVLSNKKHKKKKKKSSKKKSKNVTSSYNSPYRFRY